ncbi:hypothetical protein BV95_03904 [Sphingobium chlorophenolicum]|uniref:Uncharacterized protein n=1 Tax=Sphingobium chlorophenolicum TaxID=46429 RepID=A0A081R9F7_SPHCR|nr:hypothetical protein BV95_03904 [Sphingobium chlorophenolicum]
MAGCDFGEGGYARPLRPAYGAKMDRSLSTIQPRAGPGGLGRQRDRAVERPGDKAASKLGMAFGLFVCLAIRPAGWLGHLVALFPLLSGARRRLRRRCRALTASPPNPALGVSSIRFRSLARGPALPPRYGRGARAAALLVLVLPSSGDGLCRPARPARPSCKWRRAAIPPLTFRPLRVRSGLCRGLCRAPCRPPPLMRGTDVGF